MTKVWKIQGILIPEIIVIDLLAKSLVYSRQIWVWQKVLLLLQRKCLQRRELPSRGNPSLRNRYWLGEGERHRGETGLR